MQVKCDERILLNITREYKKLDYNLMFEDEIMKKIYRKSIMNGSKNHI